MKKNLQLMGFGCLLVFITLSGFSQSAVINEFVFNHTGMDTDEFVEVFSTTAADLSNYTLLEIEGDGSGAGVIDGVFSLGATDGDGFWTTGFLNNEFENGLMTHFSGNHFDFLEVNMYFY